MNQLTLELEPMARRSDPVTSHLAAAQAKETQAKHHRVILAALEQHVACGKDRIAAMTSLNGVQVCRRLTELQRLSKIKWTGRYVTSTSGRQEREWTHA